MVSSVLYQLLVAAEQMIVRLPMSLKERKICHEEAEVAFEEGAWVELLPWRGFFGRSVNSRCANGWHVLQDPSYSPCEP